MSEAFLFFRVHTGPLESSGFLFIRKKQRGMQLNNQLHLEPSIRTPSYVFIALYLIKQRDNFSYLLLVLFTFFPKYQRALTNNKVGITTHTAYSDRPLFSFLGAYI
jgi:hypothetical protein